MRQQKEKTKNFENGSWRNIRGMNPQEAKIIEQIEKGLLQVAELEERKLDAKIQSLENLGIIEKVGVDGLT